MLRRFTISCQNLGHNRKSGAMISHLFFVSSPSWCQLSVSIEFSLTASAPMGFLF
jgi:hypothetical protein